MARPSFAQPSAKPQPPLFRADGPAAQAASRSQLAARLRQYRAFTLDLAGLRSALAAAPLRSATASQPLELHLPLPDGSTQRFALWETPLLTPALAARYPGLHTYGGRGLDDPTALLSLTASPGNLHIQILSEQPGGAVYLEAASTGDAQHYVSYYARDVVAPAGSQRGCGAASLPKVPQPRPFGKAGGQLGRDAKLSQPVGPTLAVYRLVMTTTKEYTNSVHSAANGADYTDVMSNVAALVNDVRTIQERDLAVTMMLVGAHFYTSANDGAYDQSNDDQMVNRNRQNVETEFGAAAFDLGHLLTTNASGLAYLGVVGTSATGGTPFTYKAGGLSGNLNRTTPTAYFITSVFAHEIGHQFAASHTFNTNEGECGKSTRAATSAWEPGKGSTIMAYTDINCDAPEPNTIQAHSDAYYHTGSVEQMRTYIESIPSVGAQISSGNTSPLVTVPANRTIPQGTPFKLTATGTDADAADVSALRYNWEEIDLGSPSNLSTPQAAQDNVPLFRSVLPSTTGATRYFPSLNSLISNVTSSPVERLPTVARELNLRCTLRDYHAVSGSVATSTASGIVGGVALSNTVTLTVSAANATPFAITQPNTAVTWVAGSTHTVQWNGVGTKSSAVNCQTVNIRLSTDGGLTYPTLLAAAVPNADGTGSASITVPSLNTTAARLMVEAADNYFFDISDSNFTITTGPAVTGLSPAQGPTGSTVTISGSNFGTSAAGLGVTFNGVSGTIVSVSDGSITVTVPAQAQSGPVVVTRNGTGAGTASAGRFVVTPVVSGINPGSGPEGALVVVAGTGLAGASRITFNGASVPSSSFFNTNYTAAPNTIMVRVPLGATTGPVIVTTPAGSSNATVNFVVTTFTFSVLSVLPPLNGPIAESTNIQATFNAELNANNATTQLPIKVSSLQAGGRKAGTSSVSGSTVTFDPAVDFQAGEVVQVSVTTAARSNAGAELVKSYVSQLTTRTRATTGVSAGSNYATGAQPEHVVAGNLNGDAALDLVVANQADNTVSVLLNNGTGTNFTAAGAPIAVSGNPQSAALADLNNDGLLDLLVSCLSGTINVLKGNSDGTFSPQPSLNSVGPVQAVSVADLNGDGNLDLVAPLLYGGDAGYALIGMGNGTFGFTMSTYTGLPPAARSLALADFNEDGNLDLASASYSGVASNGSVSVHFGNGAGSFTLASSFPTAGAFYVVAADLNGDGHADIASTNTYATGAPLSVWLGTGGGLFASAITLRLSSGFAYTLSTGDYNGDGIIDLITPRGAFGAGPGVEVFSFLSGGFTGPTTITGFGNQPRFTALADVNNDRTLDFITANSTGDNTVSVALSKPAQPLPVELSAFTATVISESVVRLAWSTASEHNNMGFEVERGIDGHTFTKIGFAPGAGTRTAPQAYSLLDAPPPTESTLFYYRLRQINQDGTAAYSPVRTATLVESEVQLLVYPNPAHDAIQVHLSSLVPGTPLQLYDALGRLLGTFNVTANNAKTSLPLTDLPKGLYFIRYGQLSQRLTVE
ncbi:FG-GAP-like repeat-containing protein [Hymenobacter humi]|uniref:FG-GAP-like repeat-containing protein n=1 Tax=Hymenobacter humi TaxID=1411620 RepID=A0ABW2U320_9BACT